MTMYKMTSKTPGLPLEADFRKRRDAAALMFQWYVYRALEARALLDRPIAHRLMKASEIAYEPSCSRVSLSLLDVTLTFRAY